MPLEVGIGDACIKQQLKKKLGAGLRPSRRLKGGKNETKILQKRRVLSGVWPYAAQKYLELPILRLDSE